MTVKQATLFFILLISISITSASTNFLSIDCGASDSYTDDNGISWETDKSYISNGESRTVENTGSVPKEMQTLRVFSTRNKNCYPVTIDAGSRILVRASFYYGNYDKKSSPPTFALIFDAYRWAVVETSMNDTLQYEIIYDVIQGWTAICVAQIKPDELPFISAIEIRLLDSTMYSDYNSSFALSTMERLAFGAPNDIRYPNDEYDRIWSATNTVPDVLTLLKSDTKVMDVSNISSLPPKDMFYNAISTTNVSDDLFLPMTSVLPRNSVPVYIVLYFAEMKALSSSDNRSFAIYVNDQKLFDSVSPAYQSAEAYYITGTGSDNDTIILHPLSDSTLSPIICAIEVYTVYELGSGTDQSDVESLIALQQQFEVLTDWSGDPCLPINIELVNCSSDPVPRVTALYLSGLGLTGNLPDLSNLTALEIIDFSNNSLSGGIPESYATLPNLKELNLTDNKLSGPIPSSLANKKNIKLETTGNSNLCSAGQSCSILPDSSSPGSPNNTKSFKSSSMPKIQRNNIGILIIVQLLYVLAAIY